MQGLPDDESLQNMGDHTQRICDRCEAPLQSDTNATVSYCRPIQRDGIQIRSAEQAYLCTDCRDRLYDFISSSSPTDRYIH